MLITTKVRVHAKKGGGERERVNDEGLHIATGEGKTRDRIPGCTRLTGWLISKLNFANIHLAIQSLILRGAPTLDVFMPLIKEELRSMDK